MNTRYLTVDTVIRRTPGQVAVRVVPPAGLDLQYIYRAAMCIYWEPAQSLLEDRSDVVAGPHTSAARIARALLEEYGIALQPTINIQWHGFTDEEQAHVASILFGLPASKCPDTADWVL